MKQFYFKTIFIFCLILTSMAQAQTYNINSSGTADCGTGGLDGPFICVNDGNTGDLGVFTDTNTAGTTINSMSLTIYDACNGDFEIFLNGVSVGTDTQTGTDCSCTTIASNPNITRNITVTLTPAIVAAYVINGSNTLSVSTSNSSPQSRQCFYGADVTVTTTTLSVADFEYNTIKVHPNPASDFITISGLKKTENYEIYNLIGQKIRKGITTNDESIDIQNLIKGIYLLKLENGNTLKFVKE